MLASAPGTNWFIAGCTLMMLFALAHLGGVVHTVLTARDDPRLAGQIQAMKDYGLPPILGMKTSLWGLRQFFNFAFSGVLLAWMAANLAGLHLASDKAAAVRLLAWISLAGAIAIVALGAWFRVAQTVVTGGLAAALFAVAAITARAGAA